jgi:hypothetical protein
VSVQFTTTTEPTPNDLLVLDKTRYQHNAVVRQLAAQLEADKASGTHFGHSDARKSFFGS